MDIMLRTICGCKQVIKIKNHAPRYIIPILSPIRCKTYGPDEEVPRWWYDHSVPMPKEMFNQREFVCNGKIDKHTGLLLYEEEIGNE